MRLICDASGVSMGSVLVMFYQEVREKVISYDKSIKLQRFEKNFSQIKKEA